MGAVTMDGFERVVALRNDLPIPTVGVDEVLVRVQASSVNPVDAAIASGMLKGMAEYEFPVTLGRDVVGVVEQTGAGVRRYGAGDAVFGFVPHANPAVHDGSWADSSSSRRTRSPGAPEGVDVAAIGAAPVAALTAVAAFDALEPSDLDRVLVLGATGGVGTFFVQLATAVGAHVVAPALSGDREYLAGLGFAEMLDRDAEVAAQVRERFPDGVDAVLDLVSFSPDASVLKEGGRLASPLGAAGEGPGRANLMAVGTTANLERIAELLAAGSLRVPIQDTYPLERAGEALRSLASAHTRAKLGITID